MNLILHNSETPYAGLSIGDIILNSDPGSVLFVDPSGNLAQDNAAFKYTAASDLLLIPNIDGSEAANGDLTLQGTSHATRTTSYVILQPNGGNVGIGTVSPADKLSVAGNTAIGSAFATFSAPTNGLIGALKVAKTDPIRSEKHTS